MMCEIEPTNSPPSAAQLPSLPTSPATPYFSQNQRRHTDECFNCKKQGHWARDCPSKSPTKSSPSSGRGLIRAVDYPKIQCRCGFGVCTIYVSKTEANYNREFYTCPQRPGKKCGFFRWCDQVAESDINFSCPKCTCGAGFCRRCTESDGENAGRSYFICPIKKGLGQCSFFKWEDALEQTKVTERVDKSKGYGSPQSTCDSHQMFDIIHNDLQNNDDLRAEQLQIKEFSKRKEDTTQEFPNSVVVSTSSIMKKASFFRLMSQSEIHCEQMEFRRRITAAGEISTRGLKVLGWLGRLAFPPPRCLKDHPPGPFFCGIFPAFDPIFVPLDTDMLRPKGSTPLEHCHSISDLDKLSPPNSGQELQLQNGDLQKPTGLKRLFGTIEDEDIAELISKSFEQRALCLQSDLVRILNSIDPSDHDHMTSAADKFFSVLDAMLIDYGPFARRVREFIDSAARLSGIEQSICNEHSLQELVELYNGEKVRFDDISKAHEKAVAAFTASSKRLKSLREEASRVRDLLLRIEKDLSCCEAEVSQLNARVDAISIHMLESTRTVQKAEEALILCQQREEERSAAKAALEKARIQLQQ